MKITAGMLYEFLLNRKPVVSLWASLFMAMFSFTGVMAQIAPSGMVYQAVARDGSGNLAAKRSILVQTTILKSTATGTVMYRDEHKVNSNADGMFTVIVGQGTFLTGLYKKIVDIPWGSDKYFFNLKICVMPSIPRWGWKPVYTDMGTTQFWSVPYALSSGSSSDSLQLTVIGNNRQLKLGNYKPVSFSVSDGDSLSTNELQKLTRVGGRLLLSLNGGTLFLPDSSSTNELQSISRNGGRIILNQGGGIITVPDSSATNELQNINRNGGRIILSQGGGIINLPDSSAVNELQVLTKKGNQISLSNGGGNITDADSQQLVVTASKMDRTMEITKGNSVTFSVADGDTANWKQDSLVSYYPKGPVAIGTSKVDTAALFQVNSTQKGVLFPRMTKIQMQAIKSPSAGLLVFNTDDNLFYYWEGAKWISLNNAGSSSSAAKGTVVLLYADESQATNINVNYSPCGTGTSSGTIKTYSLAANTYSRIIAEAEGYMEIGANGGSFNYGEVTIALPSGPSTTTQARRSVTGGGTGNTGWIFPFKVSVSGASTTSGNVVLSGVLSLGGCTGGRITVTSMRVYGVY